VHASALKDRTAPAREKKHLGSSFRFLHIRMSPIPIDPVDSDRSVQTRASIPLLENRESGCPPISAQSSLTSEFSTAESEQVNESAGPQRLPYPALTRLLPFMCQIQTSQTQLFFRTRRGGLTDSGSGPVKALRLARSKRA
jgi:hypothetical protein